MRRPHCRPANVPPLFPGCRFHVCLQQALAERNGSVGGVPESEHDDSEEDAKGMARLFAEIGEAYTGLIAEGGPQVGDVGAGRAVGAGQAFLACSCMGGVTGASAGTKPVREHRRTGGQLLVLRRGLACSSP